ncbi:MAG: hypothetical protein AB7S81_05140 [Bdellovibrionales bacterium]
MKIAAKVLLPVFVALFSVSSVSAQAAEKKAKTTMPLADVGADIEVPTSVQDVMDKLAEASGDMTVEDLNEARAAAVKLEMLLDIEQKLTDLTKVRKARDEIKTGGMSSLANALPPEAFIAPLNGASIPAYIPPVVSSPPVSSPPPVKVDQGPRKVDILRISGIAGQYVAAYKFNGEDRQIRAGDKMDDGSLVASISPRGVVLSKNNKREVLPVKGAPQVFGVR